MARSIFIRDDEQSAGMIEHEKKTDENVARVTADLNEHRNADCGLVEGLTGIPKNIVRQTIRNDSGKSKLYTHTHFSLKR